jgi:predicted nucleic acid-binding protein
MYIDTSVAVKLYVDEVDSESCEAIVAGQTLVSSRLLFCELRSALLRKESRKIISSELKDELWQAFLEHVETSRIRLIPLSDLLVRNATDLISDLYSLVPLRTLDAIHLATFASIDGGPLFTKDTRMRLAAVELGLPLAY